MSVSKKEIEHLAKLARLNLTAEEINRLSKEMEQILKYVDKVKEVSELVKTSDQAVGDRGLRNDVVIPFAAASQLIVQAPKNKKNLLVVPPVFED